MKRNLSRPGELRLGDLALALALAMFGVVGTAFADSRTTVDRPVDAAAFTAVVLTGLVLAVRRRYPRATLVATTLLTSTYLIAGYPYGPILVCFLVSVYTVARYLPPARSAPVALGGLAVLLVHVFVHDAALPGYLGLLPGSTWVVVPYAVGLVLRLNQESTARQRAEAMRERVYSERLRVAQEVHDVVGHGLAAIKMQAEVALHLLAKKPDQAEVALTAISRTSTEALDELRATLSVVRRRSPAPGLARLDDLRERMADAGVRLRIKIAGTARELPNAVDFAGYRIVQESLTNVLRHGAARIATVCVEYQTEAVLITVTNPSPGAPDGHSDGLGIAGMRERVTALGGDFSAGRTGDRFEVRARLPLGSRS